MNYKTLSISLVLLCCFAATSKIAAMGTGNPDGWELAKPVVDDNLTLIFNGDGTRFESRKDKLARMNREIEAKDRRAKLEVAKNIARVSREGLQEKDMVWIINAIDNNKLSINGLKNLIKFGLKKYVNYALIKSTAFDNHKTCLSVAISRENFEIIKLLVSIGAKIDEHTLFIANMALKNPYYYEDEDLVKPLEITNFLLAEKEKQEKAEKEKSRIGKSLLQKTSPETSKNAGPDVKIKLAK